MAMTIYLINMLEYLMRHVVPWMCIYSATHVSILFVTYLVAQGHFQSHNLWSHGLGRESMVTFFFLTTGLDSTTSDYSTRSVMWQTRHDSSSSWQLLIIFLSFMGCIHLYCIHFTYCIHLIFFAEWPSNITWRSTNQLEWTVAFMFQELCESTVCYCVLECGL